MNRNLMYGPEWHRRLQQGVLRGESLPHAKLTDELVRRIRADHRPFSRTHGAPALARRLGLHRRTVEKVLAGRSWGHVQ